MRRVCSPVLLQIAVASADPREEVGLYLGSINPTGCQDHPGHGEFHTLLDVGHQGPTGGPGQVTLQATSPARRVLHMGGALHTVLPARTCSFFSFFVCLNVSEGTSRRSSGWDSKLPMQGAQVLSLVGELDPGSHRLGMALGTQDPTGWAWHDRIKKKEVKCTGLGLQNAQLKLQAS